MSYPTAVCYVDTFKLSAEIARLRSDLEKAREALRPFAEKHVFLCKYIDTDDDVPEACFELWELERAVTTLKEIDNEQT